MGFYSPEVIVNHARNRGIEVLPVDMNRSDWRCRIDKGGIRLGFRYVKAIGDKTRQNIDMERKRGEFVSLRDFYLRTRLEREAVENLILAGAFDFLGTPKRELIWELGRIIRQANDSLPLEFPSYQVPLPGMTLAEGISAEYDIQGLSAGHHPMEVFRPNLQDGILKSSQIPAVSSGARVRAAGCVVCRQRPVTAKGHVFITLEDECGLVNVILRPWVYEKYRQIARLEPFIIVEGMLQKKDGVINIVAEELSSLRDGRREEETAPTAAPRARNFC
jgi:error-prone DNA polymerase